VAHGGIVATVLDEAMALLIHGQEIPALTSRLEVDLLGPTPIGSMAYVRAWIEEDDGRRMRLAAELRSEASGDATLARAAGTFVRVRP